MKNLLVVGLLLFLTGCSVEKIEEVGNYKEGTYVGSFENEYYGQNVMAMAVIYVSENGIIESVYIDSTYMKNDVLSTKKLLGYDYGMKDTSASMGNIEGGGEWFEQIANLENKILEEQGLSWLEWSNEEETKTDSVSGVTISIDALYVAIEDALNQAKK